MIEYIQKGAFKFLTDLFQDYNIKCEFNYDPDLDLLNEYRKNQRFRVENKNSYDDLVGSKSKNSNSTNNFGLFNRTPIRKSQLAANNTNIEVFVKKYNESTQSVDKIQIRKALFLEVGFSVKLLFDNHVSSDTVELLYTTNLAGKSLSYLVDYEFGEGIEPIEDVSYGIVFSEIENIGELGTSNLRYMDFSFTVSGLGFLPYTSEGSLLEKIIVNIHAYLPSGKIDPKTATDDTLVDHHEYVMKRT